MCPLWPQAHPPLRLLLPVYVPLFPMQIGSCTHQMGQVAIVSLQNSVPKVIECFNVESRILCMVYVPVQGGRPQPCTALDPEPAAATTSNIPTVCLGTEEGR